MYGSYVCGYILTFLYPNTLVPRDTRVFGYKNMANMCMEKCINIYFTDDFHYCPIFPTRDRHVMVYST